MLTTHPDVGTPDAGRNAAEVADLALHRRFVGGDDLRVIAQEESTLRIDGEDAGAYPLSEGDEVDDMIWRVDGVWPAGRDLEEGEILEIHAWAELPDLGVTEVTVTVEVVGEPEEPPQPERVWTGQSSGVQTFSIATGSATTQATDLVFRRVSSSLPHIERYEVVSGRIAWSTEGEIVRLFEGNCTYSSGTRTYDVVPGSGYIQIDHSVDPPRYNGLGDFEADLVTMSTSCADIDFTTRA